MSRNRVAALALSFVALALLGTTWLIISNWTFLRGGEDSWAHYRSGGIFITDSPSPSRDGNVLYLATPCSGCGDIYSYSVAQKIWRQLTNDDAFESSPLLSPDGNTVAYVKESAGRRHIWLMRTDGTAQRPLTRGNVLDDLFEFSADGQYLMILRSPLSLGPGRQVTTFIIAVDGSADAQPVGQQASFVPNEQAIVFVRQGDDEILYQSLSGSQQPHALGCQGELPHVSNDGGQLMYQRALGPGWSRDNEIWLKDLESGTQTQVGVGHSSLFLSPTGLRVIYYSGYESRLMMWTSDSPPAVPISAPGGFKTKARACSDGNGAVFACFGNAGRYEVFRLDVPASAAAKLVSIDCDSLQ